jgi:hypothetical protein
MSSSKDLLEEIKVVYTTVKEFEQQTAAAANTLIAVSGTIATLLFVFGSYLLFSECFFKTDGLYFLTISLHRT